MSEGASSDLQGVGDILEVEIGMSGEVLSEVEAGRVESLRGFGRENKEVKV